MEQDPAAVKRTCKPFGTPDERAVAVIGGRVGDEDGARQRTENDGLVVLENCRSRRLAHAWRAGGIRNESRGDGVDDGWRGQIRVGVRELRGGRVSVYAADAADDDGRGPVRAAIDGVGGNDAEGRSLPGNTDPGRCGGFGGRCGRANDRVGGLVGQFVGGGTTAAGGGAGDGAEIDGRSTAERDAASGAEWP